VPGRSARLFRCDECDHRAAAHRSIREAIGLGDYGKPGNYFARQIGRWSGRQYLDDELAGRDPDMDALVEWLPANIPPATKRPSSTAISAATT
jgi:aminoglycoside phosphotransferase (APT) family kinase protein